MGNQFTFSGRQLLSTICFVFITILLSGQNIAPDTFRVHRNKHLKAAVTVTVENILINRVNRYILPSGRDWADISWESMKNNLKLLPSWDDDLFTTNWFAHPYQGSMYYLSARTLGIKPLPSIGYNIFGTLMWEYLGETLAPSTNDLFTNILGGNFLGESIFRISENILDDRYRGKKRVGAEALNFFVNPIGELNRVVYGDAFKTAAYVNHIKVPMETELIFGNIFQYDSPVSHKNLLLPYLGVDIKYGQIKKGKSRYGYFHYFKMNAFLRFDKGEVKAEDGINLRAPYWNLRAEAMLYGKEILNHKKATQVIGVFQNYDYIKSQSYEIGALGFTFGHLMRHHIKQWKIESNLYAGAISLGAGDSETVEWIKPPDDPNFTKDYIMGPGFMLKLELKLMHDKAGILLADFSQWNIYVLSGPDGRETLRFANLGYDYPINHRLRMGVKTSFYTRNAKYEKDNDVYRNQEHLSEFSLLIKYKI